MIIKLNKPRFRCRIAFFDFDWTLVKPKDGRTFPKDTHDWMWLRDSVPDVINKLYKQGYAIVIVTNQTKPWKREQILEALESLQIPLTICIAWNKNEHKPSTFLFNECFSESAQRSKINKEKSFFCGDALGRPNDHDDCDKLFAQAIGVQSKSPEEVFPFLDARAQRARDKSAKILVQPSDNPEVVIMVGYPGSGKSTLVDQAFKMKEEYFIARGDDLKTSAKMIKAATDALEKYAFDSIVFDATNPSRKKRKEYIDFARSRNLSTRCIYVATSMEESLARNNKREHPVPRIAYNLYKKNFEEPNDSEEGFTALIVV